MLIQQNTNMLGTKILQSFMSVYGVGSRTFLTHKPLAIMLALPNHEGESRYDP